MYDHRSAKYSCKIHLCKIHLLAVNRMRVHVVILALKFTKFVNYTKCELRFNISLTILFIKCLLHKVSLKNRQTNFNNCISETGNDFLWNSTRDKRHDFLNIKLYNNAPIRHPHYLNLLIIHCITYQRLCQIISLCQLWRQYITTNLCGNYLGLTHIRNICWSTILIFWRLTPNVNANINKAISRCLKHSTFTLKLIYKILHPIGERKLI